MAMTFNFMVAVGIILGNKLVCGFLSCLFCLVLFYGEETYREICRKKILFELVTNCLCRLWGKWDLNFLYFLL